MITPYLTLMQRKLTIIRAGNVSGSPSARSMGLPGLTRVLLFFRPVYARVCLRRREFFSIRPDSARDVLRPSSRDDSSSAREHPSRTPRKTRDPSSCGCRLKRCKPDKGRRNQFPSYNCCSAANTGPTLAGSFLDLTSIRSSPKEMRTTYVTICLTLAFAAGPAVAHEPTSRVAVALESSASVQAGAISVSFDLQDTQTGKALSDAELELSHEKSCIASF